VKDYSLGKLTFVAKRINVPARPFATSVACFLCEEHVLVLPGNVMAVFVIGNENVGVACDDCLTEDQRACLAALRKEAKP